MLKAFLTYNGRDRQMRICILNYWELSCLSNYLSNYQSNYLSKYLFNYLFNYLYNYLSNYIKYN